MFILQPFVVSILLAAVAGMTQNETLLGETRVEEAGSMDELLWPDLTSLVGPLLRGTSLISKFGTDYTSSDAPQRELQDVVSNVVCSTVWLLVIGWLYKAAVTDKRPGGIPPTDELPSDKSLRLTPQEFHAKVFQCFDDLPICLWACCCTHIRQGDTYHAAGVADFWLPIKVLLIGQLCLIPLSCILGPATGLPDIIVGLGVVAYLVPYRHALRMQLGAQEEVSVEQRLIDSALYLCCLRCAVAQEARDVDAVEGVQVGFCFSVQLVGEPLSVQGQPV
mmetsp:Transcript_4190/g.5841  ORF Transcript_4190/g.5841 Transcript_4190/m.5841 type:complete len:278 (-) Transcript_4190:83-916(-)